MSVPLRVAVVGSGPAGFYAADALLKSEDPPVLVDVLDRLPTPWGLVRLGVARGLLGHEAADLLCRTLGERDDGLGLYLGGSHAVSV